MSKSKKNEFTQVRTAHASETAEDYVEAIADIIAEKGVCRAVDLTKHFHVSAVTVTRTLARLARDGWVETEPYAPVDLTKEGVKLAQTARERHEVVFNFLMALGVDSETARIDSEGIEHHVSPKTLSAMKGFLKKSR